MDKKRLGGYCFEHVVVDELLCHTSYESQLFIQKETQNWMSLSRDHFILGHWLKEEQFFPFIAIENIFLANRAAPDKITDELLLRYAINESHLLS